MGKTTLEALAAVQRELKAPKGQYNSFGKYSYRSCEDILEAVKPLLAKHNATLILKDDIVVLGERVYVKATATFESLEEDGAITTTAYAREPDKVTGMSDSQITGTASSYARKYCMNALLLVDDTKDADTDEYANQTGRGTTSAKPKKEPTQRDEKKAKCAVCGKTVYGAWGEKSIAKYGDIYCSKECVDKAKSGATAPIASNDEDLPF